MIHNCFTTGGPHTRYSNNQTMITTVSLRPMVSTTADPDNRYSNNQTMTTTVLLQLVLTLDTQIIRLLPQLFHYSWSLYWILK